MGDRNKLNMKVVIRLLLPYVLVIINGSVYGNTYHTNYWTCAYFLYLFIVHRSRIAYEIKQYHIMTHLYNRIIILGILVTFLSLINLNFFDSFLFIVLFSTILIYTDMDQYLSEINVSANIMLIGSGLILIGFNTGRILSQWNPNQIAMITVSSIYFSLISWENSRHKIIKVILIAATTYGLWKTDSRAMMAGVLVALFVMWIFSKKLFLNNSILIKITIFFIAITPFMVIIWNMFYLDTGVSAILNNLFSGYTWKTVYSGREIIWSQWIPIMMQPKYLLLGAGEKINGNLHSLIVDIWYSFGAVTMLLYIHMMFSTCKYMVHMLNDWFVRTCFASFCGMYVAQSFECMSSDTTYFYVFMYAFLAMAVGRCITIEYVEEG